MIYNNKFGGLIPRIRSRLLPNGFAEIAVDVNLEYGSIRPWACPTVFCETEVNIVTIHPDDNCPCTTWNKPVDIVDYVAGGCEFTIWNERDRLRITLKDEFCEGDNCFLGIPCPTLAPEGGGYSFVYTWINQYGQEGPPSPLGGPEIPNRFEGPDFVLTSLPYPLEATDSFNTDFELVGSSLNRQPVEEMDTTANIIGGSLRVVLKEMDTNEEMDTTANIISGALDTILVTYNPLPEEIDTTANIIGGEMLSLLVSIAIIPESFDSNFELMSGTLS